MVAPVWALTTRQASGWFGGGTGTRELTVEQIDGPLACRLSEKGLQQVAGWPGALNTDLAALFLAAIEAKIATPTHPMRNAGDCVDYAIAPVRSVRAS